jgi:capsular polysaccharide transport system permease protein
MTKRKPSKSPKLLGWMGTARSAVASRLPRGRALQAVGDDLRSKLPALSQGVDLVSDALAAFGSGSGLFGRSFVAFVLFPTLFFWLYSALWQSERYVAETRLTVREAQKKEQPGTNDAASMIAKMTGGAGAGTKDTQNSYIVLNYIKSRAILLDLGGRSYFEPKFSNHADYFSRLATGANLEEIYKYWLNHVSASVDTVSGILTVRIDAFQPQDALDVAKDVVRLSEALVNQITLRNRSDALSRAESEVVSSRQKLAEAREKLLQFRNENFLIDPGSSAKSIGELVSRLTLQRIELVNALSTFSSSLSSDAPSQRLQRTRLAAIDQQLAELKKKLTDREGTDTVSAQLAGYEKLKLEEQFAERLYVISQSAFERARQDLERQQLYLVTVVAPTLPESASYPRVIANTILMFSALVIVWAIIMLVGASINDQVT